MKHAISQGQAIRSMRQKWPKTEPENRLFVDTGPTSHPSQSLVGLVAEGETRAAILAAWPDLEPEDIRQALAYVVWLAREEVMPA